MYYSIQHITAFRYSEPISESVMEVRMQPRSEGAQRCLSFQFRISPKAGLTSYRDYLGNSIHHFDIPGRHQKLAIVADSIVEVRPGLVVPERLPDDAWQQLDGEARTSETLDYLLASALAAPTDLLYDLAGDLDIRRRDDPLTVLRAITEAMYHTFEYAPDATEVDSPIDVALRTRQGVCQDYSHIMIALIRQLGIPARYVSGYLYHRTGNSADRSARDATHAWVEAWLPQLGWVGFDPTNNLICGERHIRVAVGRDYADVPPTRGVFKGSADTELTVAVKVAQTDDLPILDDIQPETYTSGAMTSSQEQSQQQ